MKINKDYILKALDKIEKESGVRPNSIRYKVGDEIIEQKIVEKDDIKVVQCDEKD